MSTIKEKYELIKKLKDDYIVLLEEKNEKNIINFIESNKEIGINDFLLFNSFMYDNYVIANYIMKTQKTLFEKNNRVIKLLVNNQSEKAINFILDKCNQEQKNEMLKIIVLEAISDINNFGFFKNFIKNNEINESAICEKAFKFLMSNDNSIYLDILVDFNMDFTELAKNNLNILNNDNFRNFKKTIKNINKETKEFLLNYFIESNIIKNAVSLIEEGNLDLNFITKLIDKVDDGSIVHRAFIYKEAVLKKMEIKDEKILENYLAEIFEEASKSYTNISGYDIKKICENILEKNSKIYASIPYGLDVNVFDFLYNDEQNKFFNIFFANKDFKNKKLNEKYFNFLMDKIEKNKRYELANSFLNNDDFYSQLESRVNSPSIVSDGIMKVYEKVKLFKDLNKNLKINNEKENKKNKI